MRARELDRELEYERLRLLGEAQDAAKTASPKREERVEVVEKLEVVKTGKTEFQKLDGLEEPKPAVRAGNWLARLEISIAELSDGAADWFEMVIASAREAYTRYQRATPLDRLDVSPEITDEQPKWVRLRSRVTEMLLDSIPKDITSELVGARKLHPSQILFRIMVLYRTTGTTGAVGVASRDRGGSEPCTGTSGC